MKGRIDVVAYDSSWQVRFEAEAGQLARFFKDSLVGIHHVGSTVVPGLSAKPILFIAISLILLVIDWIIISIISAIILRCFMSEAEATSYFGIESGRRSGYKDVNYIAAKIEPYTTRFSRWLLRVLWK